jgi:hypothetical protein
VCWTNSRTRGARLLSSTHKFRAATPANNSSVLCKPGHGNVYGFDLALK